MRVFSPKAARRLLFLALLVGLSATRVAAQSLDRTRQAQMEAAAPLQPPHLSPIAELDRSFMAADTDSTVRHYDSRNWKKGAMIGGVAGGVLSAAFAVGVLCPLSEGSCAGPTIATALIGGAIGAFVGAVLIPPDHTSN